MLQNGTALFIYMLGYLSLGSFFGEIVRAYRGGGFSAVCPLGFVINIVVGGFLSYVLATMFYNIKENRGLTLGFCALLGYQKLEVLEEISIKKIISFFGIEGDNE